MDLSTKMYLAYGYSMKSEKEAYERAMKMLSTLDVALDTARLDRYYSTPGYVDSLGGAKVFVIPKSNATMNGSWKWKETMKEFVTNTIQYLEQYYKRGNSVRILRRQEDALAVHRSEEGGQDRLRPVLHGTVAQPVQPSDTVEFCPTPKTMPAVSNLNSHFVDIFDEGLEGCAVLWFSLLRSWCWPQRRHSCNLATAWR
jgi:hypothetical protein